MMRSTRWSPGERRDEHQAPRRTGVSNYIIIG
jgi:hypothetical protein